MSVILFLDIPFKTAADRAIPHKTLIRVLNKTTLYQAVGRRQSTRKTSIQPQTKKKAKERKASKSKPKSMEVSRRIKPSTKPKRLESIKRESGTSIGTKENASSIWTSNRAGLVGCTIS